MIGQSASYDLGVARMRLLSASEDTDRGFAFALFEGDEGPWTVPHVHNDTQESFYVIDGRFTFTVGGETKDVGAGDYVLVPRGTPHVLGARGDGGRVLVLWVPGGLEKMFIELSGLAPDSLRDPAIRAEIAKRHDSVPL